MFSILLLLIPTISAKATVKKTVVGVSSAFIERSGSTTLSVFISSDEKIAGGSFDIHYNPEQLRINASDVKMTDTLSEYLSVGGSDASGKISISFAKASGSVIDGTVMEVKATVLSAGYGNINNLILENTELYDGQGKRITTQLINGQIKPFVGKESTHSNAVTVDKPWLITVSRPYNPATLNTSAVTLKRGSTDFPIELEVVNDRQFRVKPIGSYIRSTYTLEITDQLRSINGAKLNEPVRLKFKVN
ncbi:cohesin domain-containing protein [Sporosarcina sp. P3]|uniref:cohesin domain-containing protein n=1 Tax=Sporosarcina sp. P3 TaxID=2048245 RepID=UPI00117AE21E|nr:cohesin domain-containing protein [Sporosarcina sp. P3]